MINIRVRGINLLFMCLFDLCRIIWLWFFCIKNFLICLIIRMLFRIFNKCMFRFMLLFRMCENLWFMMFCNLFWVSLLSVFCVIVNMVLLVWVFVIKVLMFFFLCIMKMWGIWLFEVIVIFFIMLIRVCFWWLLVLGFRGVLLVMSVIDMSFLFNWVMCIRLFLVMMIRVVNVIY